MTSHHVYTCIIVLGHIPVGHSYWKTNLSPFSKPSLQCPAFPSVAVSSNSQSSVHHFLITNLPLPNINIVRLYHYNKNLPIKQLQLFRQVSTLAEAVGFEPTSPWGLPDFESSCQNRSWRNLTEDNGRCENPENAVFSRLSAPLCIENAVKIRVRESPPISPSSNGFSEKPIRIFDRTERFFAPKSRFWQCVKSTGYAELHQKSCRKMSGRNQNCRYRQKYMWR